MTPAPQASKVAGLVLAAGLSRRMGRPKQLVHARGRILLAYVLDIVMESELDPVVLVLGHQADDVQRALDGPQGISKSKIGELTIVFNPDYQTGQSSSIKAGIGALPDESRAALFVMGDQVGLLGTIIPKIVARAGQDDQAGVVRPRYGGREGGPVLWRKKYFPALMNLQGDTGGRVLLGQLDPTEIVYLDFPAEYEPFDVDTMEDYQAWLLRMP